MKRAFTLHASRFTMPELDQLVRDTIDLTGAAPPAIYEDDAPVLAESIVAHGRDEGFYLVGLIGGKEVGKSALVNALVGRPITEQTAYGPGTEMAIAYAHETQEQALRELLEREVPGRYRIVTHVVPRLTRQVLLDLPDIDSRYADHLDTTRRMLRHMLYPLWIQSIEKYADQQPQKLLARVAAGNDPANFIFCLNKADQADRDENVLNELHDDYAARIARTLGLDAPPRVYLVSAIQPQAFDLPDLHRLLAEEKTHQTVEQSKQLAGRQRARSVLAWLDRQNLPARADRIARLQAEAEELLAARLAVPLLEDALPRLMEDPGHRTDIADQVLHERIGRWPIVNILHTLLWPLMALIRRNLGPAFAAGRGTEAMIEHCLNPDGEQPLRDTVQAAFSQLHQSHPALAELYRGHRLWDDLPAELAVADLRRRLADTLQRQRNTIHRRLAGRGAVVGAPFRWLLTIGAVLWFPFLQPLLHAFLLEGAAATGRELALLFVQLLGVTYLLSSVAFLAVYFAIFWLILKWHTQRRVNRLLNAWKTMELPDPSLNPAAQTLEWLDTLLDPIHHAKQRIDSLIQRVEDLRQSLKDPARPAAA